MNKAQLIRLLINEILLREGGAGDVMAGGRYHPTKPIPFEYDDRFYERIQDYDLCELDFNVDSIYDAHLDTIPVQVIGKIDAKNFLVSVKSSGDEFNRIFDKLGGIKITDSDLSTSGRITNFFIKKFPNENVRDRNVKIAKIKTESDIKKTFIINPDQIFFAIISCTNPDFFPMRKIETMSEPTGFISYLIGHPIKTYSDVGKRIAELPDPLEASIIKWYNVATSALGIADLFVGRGVLGAAAIGPMLVLSSYYKYAMPNDKTFGVPTSTFYLVCAALGAVGSAAKVGAATSTGKEISDLAVLAKQYATVRNVSGLTELGLATADDASKLARPLTGAYNSSSLDTLLAFCRRFPELQKQMNFSALTRSMSGSAIEEIKNVGYWSKFGNMWSWTSAGGKALTNPGTGKAVLFSDDVRSMIIFAANHPNTIVRFVEWHNMMPGVFSKLLITLGFVGDSYIVGNVLTSIESEGGTIPEGQKVDDSNIDTQKSESIKYDYYTKLLNLDSNLKTLVVGSQSGGLNLYNLETKQYKNVFNFNTIIPVISDAISKHSSNKGANLNDLVNCKLLIVDDSIYDNFDLLVKAPINLERRVKSGQVIAFKHAPGVYSLVQKDIAINVMNSEF